MGLRTFLGLKKPRFNPDLINTENPSFQQSTSLSPRVHSDQESVLGHRLPSLGSGTGLSQPFGAIPFRSESCSSHHFLYSCYDAWCAEIGEVPRFHRKQWEFVYILQALWERGFLSEGKRGLGFGVGAEPLTAVMAKRGCTLVATDLDVSDKFAAEWSSTNQHSTELSQLNAHGICPDKVFKERASFRPVDMNDIPDDLRGFDFCWSACCFEHLGSIEKGLRFYKESLKTLKPGGLAIHTTELNLSSDIDTLDNDSTVLFRRSDLAGLIEELESAGHTCEPLLIHLGSNPIDNFIDVPTFSDDAHLRLALGQYVTTSVGIITRKA